MSTTYNKRSFPPLPAGAPSWMQQWHRDVERAWSDSEQEIQRALNAQEERASLQVVYEEPKNPQAGDEVEADGTVWNPGSGAGKYVYRSGAWVFIG